MCGIVGVTRTEDFRYLTSMMDVMSHRGPDDSGRYLDNERGLALGMRRLSIVDIESGKQPLANEDQSIWVVCNGEIYNAPDLRTQLSVSGHRFATSHSDTEVLVHAYEEYGTQMLRHLNGMFAFVIYDRPKRLLFGARDRIGIKPLYYTSANSGFSFASELKCLLKLPWLSRELDFDSLYHYISLQFVPAPASIFRDVKKLPAGCSFCYRLDSKDLRIDNYWQLRFDSQKQKSLPEWKQAIREKLEESVARWTLSDVPLACSLSGGLDSSALVGLLAKSRHLRTYSLGFAAPEEKCYDELSLARKVAKKWHCQHQEIILRPDEVLNDLRKMVWHLDEPYGGGLPSWYVYREIAKDCKVAFTGTGGDELFGNYGKWAIFERSIIHRWLQKNSLTMRLGICQEWKNKLRFPHGHFFHRYFSDAAKDEMVFAPTHQFSLKTEEYLQRLWQKSAEKSRNAVAYVDFKLQLPEEFLMVTDRFSMAHSLEARVPFLDHELVELAFSVPADLRMQTKDPKYLLREIIADLLPTELLKAPKKGFILPLSLWTRKHLRNPIQDLLSPAYLRKQGIFSEKLFARIIEPHLTGRRDFTQQVWTLMMFQMWYRSFCS